MAGASQLRGTAGRRPCGLGFYLWLPCFRSALTNMERVRSTYQRGTAKDPGDFLGNCGWCHTRGDRARHGGFSAISCSILVELLRHHRAFHFPNVVCVRGCEASCTCDSSLAPSQCPVSSGQPGTDRLRAAPGGLDDRVVHAFLFEILCVGVDSCNGSRRGFRGDARVGLDPRPEAGYGKN